jgi:hypothetical protein
MNEDLPYEIKGQIRDLVLYEEARRQHALYMGALMDEIAAIPYICVGFVPFTCANCRNSSFDRRDSGGGYFTMEYILWSTFGIYQPSFCSRECSNVFVRIPERSPGGFYECILRRKKQKPVLLYLPRTEEDNAEHYKSKLRE